MGNMMARTMDENFEKNKKFMSEIQVIQLDRQIHMHDQLRLRRQAMEIAAAREMFFWWAAFYGTALVGAIGGVRRAKKPGLLIPFVPLTFIVAYQADLAYGTKLSRITAEADSILKCEEELLQQPGGVPTASLIDAARQRFDDEKRSRLRRTII
ncbi:plasminogen receptor (KT)-like isoform X4 [Amphibalanus amphitrite]|uniref:plasminogen receptor (KT)-like isoform X4 n=1 Tax=Amphibalanus amphitrite TaxID=1232801 RepID=UPI001C918BBC|nr:plasminogen receptor (KT)-like isoform X4 [Amphibalanus amphitrite]XP_043189601.1 plasminogen receptor (KT)-like isoform X4 [Amphibalanus amphitrite]